MNIKTIIALFNALISILFISIFFMPLFIGGYNYLFAFWRQYWFAAAILPLFLVIFDITVICNMTFISLLSEEDWPALAVYLESAIKEKNRLYKIYLSLYIQASVICGNYDAVYDVESLLRQRRPRLLQIFALKIGAVYLFDRRFKSAATFFEERLNAGKKSPQLYETLLFYYGFSLYLAEKTADAASVLRACAAETTSPLFLGLCGYVLDCKVAPLLFQGQERDDARSCAANIRRRLLAHTEESEWNKVCADGRRELHIAALGTLPAAAGTWLFTAAF